MSDIWLLVRIGIALFCAALIGMALFWWVLPVPMVTTGSNASAMTAAPVL